jgi:hypothetical protein
MRVLIVALMLALAFISMRLAQTRMGLVHDRECFCDSCVAYNYPDNGNGVDYGTEGN